MTNSTTAPSEVPTVIIGVDTHKHVHVAVAIDTPGIRLGDHTLAADSGGYQALIAWAESHGRIEAFGIEGTGSYGAGLARAVGRAGHRVAEVNRADRRLRRAAGKSDTVDAEAAARAVLAGQATSTPKTADGAVEMMRQLKIARDTAVKARTTAMVTLKQIIVNAPPLLREPLQALTSRALVTRCARLRHRARSTRRSRQASMCSGRWPVAGSLSPTKSRCMTGISRDLPPRRRQPSVRVSPSARTPQPRC